MSTRAFSIAAIACWLRPPRGLPGQPVQERGDLLHRPRVHADDPLAQLLDDGAEPLGAEILQEFRPADQTIVGRDLQEGKVAPAGGAVQVLDLGDVHGCFLPQICSDGRAIPTRQESSQHCRPGQRHDG
jgi:hypothetical protein